MTYDCFTINISRLQKEFKSVFGASRLESIQRKFKHLSDQEWANVCDAILDYERTLPTMKEFEKHGQIYLLGGRSAVHSLGDAFPIDQAKCFDCGDSGFVNLVRKDIYDAWAIWPTGSGPCHCEKGKRLFEVDQKMPERRRYGYRSNFNNEWAKNYSTIPYYEKPKLMVVV